MKPIILLGPDGPAKAEALEKIRQHHGLTLRGEVNDAYVSIYTSPCLRIVDHLPAKGRDDLRTLKLNDEFGSLVVIMLEELKPGQLDRFRPGMFTVIEVTPNGRQHDPTLTEEQLPINREVLVKRVTESEATLASLSPCMLGVPTPLSTIESAVALVVKARVRLLDVYDAEQRREAKPTAREQLCGLLGQAEYDLKVAEKILADTIGRGAHNTFTLQARAGEKRRVVNALKAALDVYDAEMRTKGAK